jgi:acyl-CoA synthetase (AMP-forming)/AMP-acid ligase II
MTDRWNTPERCNVAAALSAQATAQPDAPAIHYPTGLRGGEIQYQSYSYRELDDASDACARGLLAAGIASGSRAALMVPPGREFFVLFFALFKAGIVPVLIDPGIGLKPLRQCLDEAAPDAFIGVTRAQVARIVLRWARSSVRQVVTVGPRFGWGGWSLAAIARAGRSAASGDLAAAQAGTRSEDLAAILFTSGSTGIPKGVMYRHRHFYHQVEMLREAFDIHPGETDLATFPPFALFDPALGMTTVVPYMDPTRPAKADPALLVQAINRFGCTNLFGSPALLNTLGRYTEAHGIKLPTVRRVLSAGAAVPATTIKRMRQALADDAPVHTPYGATECLPVASFSSNDLSEELEQATRDGHGTCVGRPVAPNQVAIIRVSDEAIERLQDQDFLATGSIGEIIVHGPTTTDAYWQREAQTLLAKSRDAQDSLWHRMGDIGYFDEQGRLWYCGRKSQRVPTAHGDLYPDQVEAVFNTHPAVARSALVSMDIPPKAVPALCVELAGAHQSREKVRQELLAMAAADPRLVDIKWVLFHPSFPVDIRHNSKIGREALALWAAKQQP